MHRHESSLHRVAIRARRRMVKRVQLSAGKRKRLEAVSNARGVIAALALDQRDALRSLFAAEMKIDKSDVPSKQLEEFKSIAVHALSPHASAVLLEPEYGL